MVKRWVVNASPIISLVKIDRIHLLSELCDEVIIPQGVRDEITLGGYADSAVNWLQQAGQQLVELSQTIGLRIRLIYYPPYHSKYNPIERCWAALETYLEWGHFGVR